MLVAGFFAGRHFKWDAKRLGENSSGSVKANPGPWGDLEITPIVITAPVELLKVRGTEETQVRWTFKEYSRDALVHAFQSLGVPDAMFASGALTVSGADLILTPPREVLLGLSTEALQGIYRMLSDFTENDAYRDVFLTEDMDAFKKGGVSSKTLSLIKMLSSTNGKYMICYCMPYVLSGAPTFEEKAAVLDIFTRQKSLLLKLRISSKSDINALTNYWGKAYWAANVGALLESVKNTEGGGLVSIGSLLPPLPKTLIYTFPMPQNGLNGPVTHQDCHWTAFNFFRDPPDNHFSDPGYIYDKLKNDYFPLQSDPLYGDVIMLARPNGSIIHSMVYVADNIVYTKNGENLWHPWMYSRLSDVVDIYSVMLPPGQQLSLRYFRNKYY